MSNDPCKHVWTRVTVVNGDGTATQERCAVCGKPAAHKIAVPYAPAVYTVDALATGGGEREFTQQAVSAKAKVA
jgi:hypothetical protein